MNDNVGIRSKCSLVQKINRCHSELSVKLVIGDPEITLHTFTAFQNEIKKNTEDTTISFCCCQNPSPAHMQDVRSLEFSKLKIELMIL